MTQIEKDHSDMVAVLVKNPLDISATLTNTDVDLIHAVLGIAGEAGELVDAIKKKAIYNKPLDVCNVVEELGDLEFYMEQMRQRLYLTREMCLEANMKKLAKRYKDFKYTDQQAHQRADKA